MRSRKLCRSSSRRRKLFLRRKTGCSDPEKGQEVRLFYSCYEGWPWPPALHQPQPFFEIAYLLFGTQHLRREQRRNVLSTWNQAAILHLWTNKQFYYLEKNPQFQELPDCVTYLHISTTWKQYKKPVTTVKKYACQNIVAFSFLLSKNRMFAETTCLC